jgi:uncharacterized protein (DUF58 family)
MVFSAVITGAWLSGERILYLSALVLFLLPILSYCISFLLLRGLRVSRTQPDAVTKNTAGKLIVGLHNITFMPLGYVSVLVNADENAIKVLANPSPQMNPFGRATLEIPFEIEFRGHFDFGLRAVQISDITGLFTLTRYFDGAKYILSLPHVVDASRFPLTSNLMTQLSSRYDVRDEDYSTISDVRQYLPTDSIKRVHWKLTAKRNEWLVKNFQSNALNLVSVLVDSTRLTALEPRENYKIEDAMVENALGLAKFCLNKGMPVDFLTTEGRKASAKAPGEFELIYQNAAEMHFTEETALDVPTVLSQELTEGYVNAVILTAQLTAALYERVINCIKNGHHMAILYFAPEGEEEAGTSEIFRLLNESAAKCIRVM